MVNKTLRRVIIAAVSENRIIGIGNKIPWHSKEELSHFKNTTLGYPIIFGRKTFQSIGTVLPDRLNIVISKNLLKIKEKENLLIFRSLKDAYKYLIKNNYNKVFIAGGERIYRNSIKHAEEMIISFMNFNSDGDKKFPKINSKIWELKSEIAFADFRVKHFIRKNF